MVGRLLISIEARVVKAKQKYLLTKIKHGKDTTIGGNCKVNNPHNIIIGEDTMINDYTMLHASTDGKIIIGSHCMISYYVCLRTLAHNYMDLSIPMKQQGQSERSIVIGNDVWIGYGAIIMPGVTIGDGCVVGAGAVVTRDCEPYGVYVGSPARKIKSRKM